MKKKALIFDLDGVICSTDHFHYLAWKTIADQEGIYFDEVINNRLRGISRLDSLDIILEKAKKEYSKEEKLSLAQKKNSIYRELLKNMTKEDVTEDVRYTLKELKKRGYLIAIGSASKNTKFILERIGLINAFDEIVDGTMITHSKPDPEVFLKAASLLSLTAEECYVVEDAKAGIEAGYRGGFTTIGIQDAKDYIHTDYGIDDLSDVLKLIQ